LLIVIVLAVLDIVDAMGDFSSAVKLIALCMLARVYLQKDLGKPRSRKIINLSAKYATPVEKTLSILKNLRDHAINDCTTYDALSWCINAIAQGELYSVITNKKDDKRWVNDYENQTGTMDNLVNKTDRGSSNRMSLFLSLKGTQQFNSQITIPKDVTFRLLQLTLTRSKKSLKPAAS